MAVKTGLVHMQGHHVHGPKNTLIPWLMGFSWEKVQFMSRVCSGELLCPITLTNHHWYVSNPFQIPEIISATFATSEIPGTKFLHLNSVFINSQPWRLFIVKSHLLSTSNPATMCSLFMYILPQLCSTHTLFIPDLTPIAPPFSLTNAMPVDLYIRLPVLYDIFMFKYWLLVLSLTTQPHLDSPTNPSVPNFQKTLVTPEI